jgi:hypothetical protein
MKKNNTLIIYVVLIFVLVYLFIYFIKAAISLLLLLALLKFIQYMWKRDKRLNQKQFSVEKKRDEIK